MSRPAPAELLAVSPDGGGLWLIEGEVFEARRTAEMDAWGCPRGRRWACSLEHLAGYLLTVGARYRLV